jgi:cell division protein FtsN
MRTFAILLLLTNLVYFGWNQGWLRETQPARPRAVATVQAPAADFGGLQLLSELSDAERQERRLQSQTASAALPAPAAESAAPAAAAAVAAAAPVAAVKPWCAELGPFETVQAAAPLRTRLEGLGVQVRQQDRELPVASTFWVYLPAFADEAEARRILAELQARKIDSYYMRSGQFSGGISLGVFSRRASAEKVQADMAAKGYRASIGEVQREEPRSYLILRAPDEKLLGQSAWADFRRQAQSWNLTEKSCEGVASVF